MASTESWILAFISFLFVFPHIHSFTSFKCPTVGGNAPSLPEAYSANIRINYMSKRHTIEMQYATNGKGKELIELIRYDRRVKYITREDQKSALFIEYKEDEHPKCTVTKSTSKMDFLQDEDAGNDHIILKAIEVMMFPQSFDIYSFEPSVDTGVYTQRYEGCMTDPKINISYSFAAGSGWNQTHTSSLKKDVYYPEMLIAQIGKEYLTALFSYFDPTTPDEAVFQPPFDVYCEGFRSDKKPPTLPNFFSYDVEFIEYQSALGIAPTVTHRKVYYDIPSEISRVDYYEITVHELDSMFNQIEAKPISTIHDYNAGIEYIFDSDTGKCDVRPLEEKHDVVSIIETDDDKMFDANEYFWLNGSSTSYNGQFRVRGMMADVYTSLKVDVETNRRYIISWYFSAEMVRFAETENVEKNALLRMYIRPETDMGEEGVFELNFYNFDKQEPSASTYDLTHCFNETSSKTLVFTFPAIDDLRGSEKLIGKLLHSAIKDITGVRKQRVYMKEVIYNGKYMYGEFTLLEAPYRSGRDSKEISLDDAVKKLKDAVSDGKFSVKVPTEKEAIILEPEPNGLNVFSGDRVTKPEKIGYKEGDVIALTIGMLILGLLLGVVAMNLVMSRKFGVSLFQKSRYGNSGFNNPLSESGI